jgi:zinc D-Ala-D-Ala carboxypeptidase
MMDHEFMAKLQALRDAFGRSLTITSGFRCPDHNKAIGGEPDSYHLLGKAADIACIMGGDKYKLVRIAMSLGFGGLGIGQTLLHVDIRAINPTIWIYPNK